jgi:hypothetical protein
MHLVGAAFDELGAGAAGSRADRSGAPITLSPTQARWVARLALPTGLTTGWVSGDATLPGDTPGARSFDGKA